MKKKVSRRALIARTLSAMPVFLVHQSRAAFSPRVAAQLAELERRSGGRLGVAALDVSTGDRVAHRGDERFAMCSTFKTLAVGLVLRRTDRGEERLDRRVRFTAGDLVEHSPLTSHAAGDPGMTVEKLCEAVITVSDNTAANLLLASFGGPSALTAYVRGLGDGVTRLDRVELAMNDVAPGDPRDTTSPAAMLENVRRLVLGNELSPSSRDRLRTWLLANQRYHTRLRAGFPAGWIVGNKPGTGPRGATNDVAVAWRNDNTALIVSAYFAGTVRTQADRDAVIAQVARLVSQRA